ncbi:hypothetical protein P9273_03505 [Mesorhizobium sp. WSM4935]|uniref:hypothetical protein n=1 Tax=Mesorhizobium sp. WSM4935 TaxID=3038547 RepID=UPI0024158412|nr:hypothetical protein [Mesorhizobium sp. WSM4935]MDG4874164.1 hypothetical protein [Mesorhizobium sp. WSM4935]
MNDTLDLVEDLRKRLTHDAPLDEAMSWWDVVQRIESSLEFDRGRTKADGEAVERLKSAISEMIAAFRQGLHPEPGPARRALMSIQQSVERRTTGVDGYPLRK